MSIPQSLIILVPIVYVAILVYVLVLVTRLVKAVERIADKLDPTSK
jgi:hypothetical protein